MKKRSQTRRRWRRHLGNTRRFQIFWWWGPTPCGRAVTLLLTLSCFHFQTESFYRHSSSQWHIQFCPSVQILSNPQWSEQSSHSAALCCSTSRGLQTLIRIPEHNKCLWVSGSKSPQSSALSVIHGEDPVCRRDNKGPDSGFLIICFFTEETATNEDLHYSSVQKKQNRFLISVPEPEGETSNVSFCLKQRLRLLKDTVQRVDL